MTHLTRQLIQGVRLQAARDWLTERAKTPLQCECEQCLMVLRRQAVQNVLMNRANESQASLL